MEQWIPTTIAAVLGFLGKSLWDLYWKRREEAAALSRQKRLEILERQLSQFYWPLYLHLQKNNVIWEHLVQGAAIDRGLKKTVDEQLYSSFFLPNHEAMVKVIEAGVHLARPDGDFQRLLLRFIRHVTIFRALRDAKLPYDPVAVGEPWPSELFDVLEGRLRALQAEFDRDVGISTNPS